MGNPGFLGASGPQLTLRLVQLDDAAYIHALRSDPAYGKYLSDYDSTVAQQRDWLKTYKSREKAGSEYYYVIERNSDAQACGLIRLYGITQMSFTWGSWILGHNKPGKAALESAVLSFGIGFHALGLPIALIDVRHENAKARSFYERFGMQFLRDDHLNRYYEYSAAQYERDLPSYLAILEQSALDENLS